MSLKYAYINTEGGLSIVHGASKDDLERQFGQLTDEQYELIVKRAIPDDAVDVVQLPDDWVSP